MHQTQKRRVTNETSLTVAAEDIPALMLEKKGNKSSVCQYLEHT
jgi:hypothetical protein